VHHGGQASTAVGEKRLSLADALQIGGDGAFERFSARGCRSKERSSGLRPERSMVARWHSDVFFMRYAFSRQGSKHEDDQRLRWSDAV
jgi:hypothetical protein